MATRTAGDRRAAAGRAAIAGRTLRLDRWWAAPLTSLVVLSGFVVYSTWAAFQNANYYAAPYISPFYSPCIAENCAASGAPYVGIVGSWWTISPAILILIVPLGFRLTCYYYRKAYYRSFWLSPPACAVAEPRARYTGETRLPLILQNAHRYFLYLALVFNVILTWDAVLAFRSPAGDWGHMGLGTVVLVINAGLLWLYSLSCHSCRHLCGGNIDVFSKHPIRYRLWLRLSVFNARHPQFAWASLVWVALTDLYVRLLASGSISDPRFF
jgi:hypothetical protein